MANTTVKERPILFSGPMVRAILAGQKTQTRRMIKPQPPSVEAVRSKSGSGFSLFHEPAYGPEFRVAGPVWAVRELVNQASWGCPYGSVGDRLWVRETWASTEQAGEGSPWVVYRADDPDWGTMTGWKWQPSIFMRLKDCRIKLEITGVRAERLKDMPYADAEKEGFADSEVLTSCATSEFNTAHRNFALLWDKLNGPGAYDLNPWVWVIEFKRIAL